MFGVCQALRCRRRPCRSSGVTSAAEPSWDLPAILTAALAGTLTEPQAAALPGLGSEAVVAFAMAMAGRVAALVGPPGVDPATPSGMVPVYQKPAAGQAAAEAAGGQAGARGVAAEAAGGRRRPGRAPAGRLPVLRRRPAAVRPDPDPADRGRPRRRQAGRHGTHGPPRLLPPLQEARRAGRARRDARGRRSATGRSRSRATSTTAWASASRRRGTCSAGTCNWT